MQESRTNLSQDLTFHLYSLLIMGCVVCPPSTNHVYPEPQNMTLFENRVLADSVILRVSKRLHLGFRVGPTSNDRCPYKIWRGHRDTQQRRWCGNRSRDWRSVSIHQGAPRITGHNQRLGENHGIDSPLEPSEQINIACTFISDIWSLELWENIFWLFQATRR